MQVTTTPEDPDSPPINRDRWKSRALLASEIVAAGAVIVVLSLNPVVGTAAGLGLGYVSFRRRR